MFLNKPLSDLCYFNTHSLLFNLPEVVLLLGYYFLTISEPADWWTNCKCACRLSVLKYHSSASHNPKYDVDHAAWPYYYFVLLSDDLCCFHDNCYCLLHRPGKLQSENSFYCTCHRLYYSFESQAVYVLVPIDSEPSCQVYISYYKHWCLECNKKHKIVPWNWHLAYRFELP